MTLATETTFKSLFSGRMPGLLGGAKVPGPGLKIKVGRFTLGTSEYPDDGYTAADLAVIVGLTRIEAIVPCGPLVDNSGEDAFPVGWDGSTRTLRVYANAALDGNSLTVGTVAPMSELATNGAAPDSSYFDALVIGY